MDLKHRPTMFHSAVSREPKTINNITYQVISITRKVFVTSGIFPAVTINFAPIRHLNTNRSVGNQQLSC